MRTASSHPRGVPSSVVFPSSPTGVDTAETSGVAATDADVPPPTTSDDSDIQRTLDHVLTIQAAHG